MSNQVETFQEKRTNRSKASFLVIGFTVLFLSWGVVQQVIFDIPFLDGEIADGGLLGAWAIGGILLLYLASQRMITKLEPWGVVLVGFPSGKERIPRSSWKQVEVVALKSPTEYGGSGFRVGMSRKKRVHILPGDTYVIRITQSDRVVVIGTRKPKEWAERLS